MPYTKRPRLAVLAVPVGAAMLIAGCGNSASGHAQKATTSPAAPTSSHVATAFGGTLSVTTTEFAFAPMTATAKAGKVKLTLVNNGKIPHEMVVLKTDQAPGSLEVKAGRVSEADSVGEVSETPAGVTKSSTLDLKPGRYVFVCNIPGHYHAGMHGTLTVR